MEVTEGRMETESRENDATVCKLFSKEFLYHQSSSNMIYHLLLKFVMAVDGLTLLFRHTAQFATNIILPSWL